MLPAIDTPVQFIKEYANYHTGQTACFTADMANKFIVTGIAIAAGPAVDKSAPKTRTLRDKIIRKS